VHTDSVTQREHCAVAVQTEGHDAGASTAEVAGSSRRGFDTFVEGSLDEVPTADACDAWADITTGEISAASMISHWLDLD
jgi:hypothetical protein